MLFIFDWDGTLCNSLDKIVQSTQLAAQEVGLTTPSIEAVKEIVGLSLVKALDRVFPSIEPDQLEALVAAYGKHYSKDTGEGLEFFPGVRESLDQLLADGHQIAVATGKSRRGLNRVFAEMAVDDYFHASRCADETASKPNPKMLRELLQEFGITAQQAVMVGDTEYDMEMARSIEMERIAVSYGAHHIDRLQNYDPVLCLDEFTEILQWQN